VRHRVADAADLAHQVLDLVEHPVDRPGQPVELVVVTADRQAPAQVAAHDLGHGGLGGSEAPARAAREQQAAEDGERQRRHQPEPEGPQGRGLHPVDLVGVVRDHHDAAVGEGQRGRPDLVLKRASREVDRRAHPVGVAVAGQMVRHRAEIARPARPVRAEQAAVMGGVGIHRDPRVHAVRGGRVVGRRRPDLQPQRLGEFLAEIIGRLPVDEGEHRQGEQGGPQGDAERPAEGGGAQQVSHRARA
jgi:hypothetical protein